MEVKEVKQVNVEDPLETSCDDIDTSMSKVPEGQYILEIRKPSLGTSKKEPQNPNKRTLKVPCVTITDMVDTAGSPLYAGFPITEYVGIDYSDQESVQRAAKRIASIVKATGLSGITPKQVLTDPMVLDGKRVWAKTKIKPADGQYDEGNAISAFIPLDKAPV